MGRWRLFEFCLQNFLILLWWRHTVIPVSFWSSLDAFSQTLPVRLPALCMVVSTRSQSRSRRWYAKILYLRSRWLYLHAFFSLLVCFCLLHLVVVHATVAAFWESNGAAESSASKLVELQKWMSQSSTKFPFSYAIFLDNIVWNHLVWRVFLVRAEFFSCICGPNLCTTFFFAVADVANVVGACTGWSFGTAVSWQQQHGRANFVFNRIKHVALIGNVGADASLWGTLNLLG